MVLDVMARLGAEVAMIDIRHKETGTLPLQVNAEPMAGIQLSDEVLRGADLRGADLRGAQLRRSVASTAAPRHSSQQLSTQVHRGGIQAASLPCAVHYLRRTATPLPCP